MHISDAVRMVSVIALEEYRAFSSRLKSKPKERALVAREYRVEMALNGHRVETMTKKYKQVNAAGCRQIFLQCALVMSRKTAVTVASRLHCSGCWAALALIAAVDS